MAKILTINTGVQEYAINAATVRFNSTDYVFAERLVNVFDKMDALQSKYKGQLQAANNGNIWKACREIDKEMRAIINELFADDVADGIFGKTSCFALADGLPVWCNVIFAIMDEIDATVIAEQKKTDPRLDAYLAKYKEKHGEN